MPSSDPKRELLRHPLAIVAYRGTNTMQTAPEFFAHFKDAGQTLGKILVHRGDLLKWALFRGPIADALTHCGQLARLRRKAGATVGGENYFVARVGMGGIGPEQGAPERVPPNSRIAK